jgi:RNA polymerase sigma-70 factor (ECF subfamily)
MGVMGGRERQRKFEALLRAHLGIVFKVARMYAYALPDRDDLVQEIALQAWRSFPSFDAGRARFPTWLYRVALNVAISSLRARGRDVTGRADPLDGAHAATLPDPGAPHEARAMQAERAAALRAFIDRLEPLNRALVLLYFEEHSYADIAAVLGISATNVATKLNRIKHQLRHQMIDVAGKGARHGTR